MLLSKHDDVLVPVLQHGHGTVGGDDRSQPVNVVLAVNDCAAHVALRPTAADPFPVLEGGLHKVA